MTNMDSAINKQLEYLYSNGKGEVGLEVGADAGLGTNDYIQVPECMKKRWAAKVKLVEYNKVFKPIANIKRYIPGTSAKDYHSEIGWVTSGKVRIVGMKKEVMIASTEGENWIEIEEIHVDPMTSKDMAAFYTVNVGHIDDENIGENHHMWVHAVRFWAVAGGLVTANKNKEYTIVPTPKEFHSKSDTFCSFAINYSANAWTACAARTTSWKKTNHCTGGTPAIGLPRRWMQKENHWKTGQDISTQKKSDVTVTSAFYVATHAVSVHAVLAQLAPSDEHHWCLIDPSYGFIQNWDIGESVKVRMVPRDQVAGTAMVVDSLVVLRMLTSDGLAPILEFSNQAEQLVSAHEEVKSKGMMCGVYKSWYFDGYPGQIQNSGFSQRSTQYFDLVNELAIVAVKFYLGSTIAQSPTLQNVARQSSYESIKANWSAAAQFRHEIATGDLIKVIGIIKGVSGAPIVKKLLSEDANDQYTAISDFNRKLTQLGTLLDVENVKQLDVGNLLVSSNVAIER